MLQRRSENKKWLMWETVSILLQMLQLLSKWTGHVGIYVLHRNKHHNQNHSTLSDGTNGI